VTDVSDVAEVWRCLNARYNVFNFGCYAKTGHTLEEDTFGVNPWEFE
jgi:hypothetical protein